MPTLTALIVGLIAGTVSLVVAILAKDQKTSEFRQVWIDALRNDVCQFMGQLSVFKTMISISNYQTGSEFLDYALAQQKELTEITMLASRIKLRLNPDEHQDLILVLGEVDNLGEDEIDIDAEMEKVCSATQKILKSEWERVKRGEPSVVWLKRISKLVMLAAALFLIGMMLNHYGVTSLSLADWFPDKKSC